MKFQSNGGSMKKQILTNSKMYLGDCLEVLDTLPKKSVNLIMTSPPYGVQRKGTYGGTPPDKYVDWFLPITKKLKRVLADNGSFILNIKEHKENGEKHDYVMRTVLAMREQGWKLIDDLIWVKPSPAPGSRTISLIDAWEHCFHFSKTLDIKFDTTDVRVPISEAYKRELIKAKAKRDAGALSFRRYRATGSGFSFNNTTVKYSETRPPTNVLTISNVSRNRGHSAVYPVELPSFFIKLLTQKGDTVLDPFMGSGTTAEAALSLKRKVIGIEMQKDYYELCKKRIAFLDRKSILESSIK